jgi:hypothetical protein
MKIVFNVKIDPSLSDLNPTARKRMERILTKECQPHLISAMEDEQQKLIERIAIGGKYKWKAANRAMVERQCKALLPFVEKVNEIRHIKNAEKQVRAVKEMFSK